MASKKHASCRPAKSSARMGDMIGETGFRKAVRLERGVGRVVVYPVAPVAERLKKGPTMGGQWGLREEENIWGVLVQHRDDVDQRGTVGPRFFCVYGEESEGYGRRGGGCRIGSRMVKQGPCGALRKDKGRSDLVWICPE